MKPSVYRKRLLALADFLDELDPNRFDYKVWVGYNGQMTWEDGMEAFQDCGTTACALGWACTMPKFRKLGLDLNSGVPTLKGVQGAFPAAANLFGLTDAESYYLFEPSNYPPRAAASALSKGPSGLSTPKDVAAHLRKFADWKWEQ